MQQDTNGGELVPAVWRVSLAQPAKLRPARQTEFVICDHTIYTVCQGGYSRGR
jgi:hypothetical protein